MKKLTPWHREYGYKFLSYLLIAAVITAMLLNRQFADKFKAKTAEDGTVIEEATPLMQVQSGAVSVAYSLVLITIGALYKKLAVLQTQAENWQYNKQYEDQLISRLFLFNIFNFYLPMLTVAFDDSNSRNFIALFYMLLTQLAGNQIAVNILEYIRQLILARQQLKEHHAAYKDVLAQYKDLGRPGSRGEPTGERLSANKVNAEKSTNDQG